MTRSYSTEQFNRGRLYERVHRELESDYRRASLWPEGSVLVIALLALLFSASGFGVLAWVALKLAGVM